MSRRRSPEEDAEFRRIVADAKQRHNLSDVIGRATKLRRSGSEMVGLCIFHEERTPSLNVNDAKGAYLCRGCGATGDIVSAVMHIEKLSFADALRWLGAADLPKADPSARVKAIARDEADKDARVDAAAHVWANATPVEGTPAEVYLRSRGILRWPNGAVRFARTWAWCDFDTGQTGPDLPALLVLVTDASGQFYGIQRIFLTEDGRKSDMRAPKRSLGRARGGTVRLGPAKREIVLCEGPEDGLSLAQELPDASVWVVLGTAMMPEVDYPAQVRSIVIAGQNDAPGHAAVEKAAAALTKRGFAVRSMWPRDGFKDWNDQLRGITS